MRSLSIPLLSWTACLAASVAVASPLQALEVSATSDAATLVTHLLGASGFVVSEKSFSGASGAAGTFTAGPLGLADGILLSSGLAIDASPPNTDTGKGVNHNLGGDPLCTQLAPSFAFYDAARLDVKFSVKPDITGMHLEYVVGSEEYPEFVGQNFNDVVGIFVDGKNVALDADGQIISINGPFFSGKSVITENGTQFDGTTPRLAVDVPLAGESAEHTLTIVVCDAGDGVLDTAVFVSGLAGCTDCTSTEQPGTTTWCGDGTIDPGNEDCDDGNNIAEDGCDNSCHLLPGWKCEGQPSVCEKNGNAPECGNGKIEGGEQCDDGNTDNGDGCSFECKIEELPPACGDGKIDGGEQCDDGNTDNGDGCDSECKIEEVTSECGDGICNGPETHASCPSDCGPPGDAVLCAQAMCPSEFAGCASNQACGAVLTCLSACTTEACFGGCMEAASPDAAATFGPLSDCASKKKCEGGVACGDGKKTDGEQCDDGNTTDGDGCSATCQTESTPAAECGNEKVETGETCDDGNTTDGDGCSATCQTESTPAAECGNSKVESGETCDDGNKTAGDGCSATCQNESTPATCGNGKIDSGEQCDDGNTAFGDGCSSSCQIESTSPACGNSKVESGETCDDGNKTAGDGCSATCQTEDPTSYPPGSIQLLGGGCTAAPAGSTSGGGLWAVLGLLAALLMVRLRRAPQAAWLVLVALIAAPNAYAADGGYSLQRFRAQTSTQGLLHSEGAKILDAWTPAVGLWLHDDEQPLTVTDTATGKKLYDEVGRQVSAQLVAALGLFGFAELGLAIPVVLNQSGEDRPTGLGTAPSLGAGAGDIRLIPKVKLLQTGALNIALSAAFDLPTASAAYSGDDGVGVEPRLNASLQDTTYGALVGLGTRIRPSFSPTITGSNQSIQIGNEAQATLGGWLNVVPETLDLLVDSRFAVNLEQQDAEERSGEVLGGVRLHLPAELVATAAAGPGFGQSPGTPAFRAVLGLMWAPNPGLDTDGDGIVDKQDKCPKVAEDKDAFEDGDGCIDPDNDKDGILDVNDKCPLDPEDKDQFEDENGCPDPDNDKDGILDVDDKCPIEFGVKEEEGCPVRDRDGDGYPDKTDKCPDKPETFNGIEDEDGCPDKANKVEVTETEIKILDKVFFDTAKATIKPVSFPILDAVAAVLKSTPRVGKVRVEGHTDDVDTDENNNKLSQARSESVMAYLVGKGVAAERLIARGFGESKPLCKDSPDLLTKGKKAKKQLDACRETNRRVQFKLLEMNGKTLPEDEDPQTIETSRPAK